MSTFSVNNDKVCSSKAVIWIQNSFMVHLYLDFEKLNMTILWKTKGDVFKSVLAKDSHAGLK